MDPWTPPPRRRWIGASMALASLAVLVAAALLLRSFLAKPEGRRTGVQSVALIKQPPPPPPKPPEKPPEPPKVKEDVKLPEPKAEPKPDEPKPQPDEKPASEKPLGVDAAAGAGTDGFGLVGSKGGRDLLTTGAGGSGAYYSGLLQRQFFEALSRNRKVLKEEFRVVVKIWLGDDGRVQRADIVSGSGNAQVDEMIQATLAEMPALRDVPPSSMRPMQLRLSNRS
jgi:protein TonB